MQQQDFIHKANIPSKIVYPLFIEIQNFDNTSLNFFIEKNWEKIKKSILRFCKNVEISYVKNSAVYKKKESYITIIAKPIQGYKWEEYKGLTNKAINIFFPNIILASTSFENDIYYDSDTPLSDIFDFKIVLNEKNSKELDEKLKSITFNEDTINKYFRNFLLYKNVNLSYVYDSANIETNTCKLYAFPIEGHEWKEKTNTKKTIILKLNNIIILNSEFHIDNNVATIPLFDEWNEQIFFERLTSDYLIEKMRTYKQYLIENITNLKFIDKYKNVDVFYSSGDEKLLNNKTASVFLQAKPKQGCYFFDNSTTIKKIQVFLKNIAICNVEYISEFNYEFDDLYIVKTSLIKSNVLDEIFKKENLDLFFKNVLKQCENYEIKYWIEKSKKIINRNEAQIQLYVIPKDNYYWVTRTKEPKIVTINIKNIFVYDN